MAEKKFWNFHAVKFTVNTQCTVWKNEKFSLTWKIFCQINSLVTSLFSKTVTFTKFSSKNSERESPQFPHCTMWKSTIKRNTLKKFRETNSLVKNVHLTEKSLYIYFKKNYFTKKYHDFLNAALTDGCFKLCNYIFE